MPAICGFFYGVRKMPLPNILEFIGTNISQRKFQEAQEKLLNYLGIEVPTKTELSSAISNVNDAIAVKVDKDYLDTALSSFQNGAIKTYPTLSAANADIANIALNTKVSVLSETDGGDYYKASADATSLTKSPYDPLTQAKVYSNEILEEKVEELDPRMLKYTKYQQGVIFTVSFIDGEASDLSIGPDGQLAQFVVDRLAARMGVQNLGSLSRIDLINCLGDSLTEGGTTDGSKYTTFLQNTMPNGTAVNNFGISGQESMDIAIRCGAVSYKVDTFTISTNSPVSITAKQLTRKKDGIAINGRTRGSCTGYFSGIHGTLNMVWDAPTFTPDFAPESPVIIPDNTEFSPDHANQIDKEGVLIWWSGQNDLAFGWPYVKTAPRDCAKAMVDVLEANRKRVVIIGVTTTTSGFLADVTSQNNLLREYVSELKTAGHDAVFLDAQAMLTDVNILKDLDVDLNDAAVQASLTAGLIPTDLTTDDTHFNADVKENFTAKELKRIFAKKGWL